LSIVAKSNARRPRNDGWNGKPINAVKRRMLDLTRGHLSEGQERRRRLGDPPRDYLRAAFLHAARVH